LLDLFKEIWCTDFEFRAPDGECPMPLCMVAHEFRTGRLIRIWRDELTRRTEAPFNVGPDSLFVAYYASAEMGCFLALNWPLPTYILDLFVEFRRHTNGRPPRNGNGLLGALTYFGLDAMDVEEKVEMRNLALRPGEHNAEERAALLNYCESDVNALIRLLSRMARHLDHRAGGLGRMLLRGQFMKAAAHIEACGVPIDVPMLETLRSHWSQIERRLIARIDCDYGVFDGTTFKLDRWGDWLARHSIPWPRTEKGRLELKDNTFREFAKMYPQVAPIHELRATLGQLRLNDLAVGSDERNRTLLSAFGARSGRNTPSSGKFVFGPAVWLRSLIRPRPGYGLAYLDFSSEEFGIGAILSGDHAMISAYASGDPYLAFAQQVGAIPADGTRKTHESIRDRFKMVSLGINYGMGPDSLAARIGQPVAAARNLLQLHRETYRDFWRWSDGAVDHAMASGSIETVFGWQIWASSDSNPRSLRNFPLQGNGADLLRLACSLATERGIRVCAPVHDAVLLEAPLDEIEQHIAVAESAMREASRAVLSGFELRVDCKVVKYPDRFSDRRGETMWRTVCGILDEL
jgi:DNA polymerase I